MATTEIKDFKSGLDTRRPAIVGEQGSLIECVNAHITRGGDVEAAKSFTPFFTFLTKVQGFHAGNGKIYVFGSDVPPTNLPGTIIYQQLTHPGSDSEPMGAWLLLFYRSAPLLVSILAVENFKGKVYVIAEYEDGSIVHFYNQVPVADWVAEATLIADDFAVTTYLSDKIDALTEVLANDLDKTVRITAAVAGVPFTIATTVIGTGTLTLNTIQIGSDAITERRATASFSIAGGAPAPGVNVVSSVKADAVELLAGPADYTLDNTATALQVVISINSRSDTHGYTATSFGSTISITAPIGSGVSANTVILTVATSGIISVGAVTSFTLGRTASPAIAQVVDVTIGGTFAVKNTYTVLINNRAIRVTGLSSGYSRILKTFAGQMHSAVRALDITSAIDDPTSVTTGTGINTLDVSSQDQGSQRLTAYGNYQNLLAMFSRDNIQLWQLDPDPANNTFKQLMQNTGTRSPLSVMGYGSSDVIYLDERGIRSLRARDASNAAYTDDVGTKIDTNVIAFLATLTDEEIIGAVAICDPIDGRAWMAIKNRIYVFSYFPGSKVSAWSYYEPGFDIDGMAVSSRRIYVKSGLNVFQVGGLSGSDFPADGIRNVRIRLPFIDAQRIAEGKKLRGIDIICQGEWTIQVLVDPTNETLMTAPLHVAGPTTLIGQIPLEADTTHFAPLLTSDKGGNLTLSSVVIHFDDEATT